MVVLTHSSDLHLSADLTDGLLQLRRVLAGSQRVDADAVLLAGDTFEHIRYPLPFFEDAGALLAEAGRRVVILPGNHDPLFEASEPRWQALAAAPNVTVLGMPDDAPVRFDDLDVEIWGWAHRSYSTMMPLRDPPPRGARWQIAMAHGHFSDQRYEPGAPAPSWLIFSEDIAATSADYVALGHWNIHQPVGEGSVPAYYSGSPDLEHTLNVIRLGEDGIQVERFPLA